MSRLRLLARTLWYFRWANVAVMFAVAVGTAALTGSLIVGDSVRHGLARLVERRLGDVDHVMVTSRFFVDSLAERLGELPAFRKGFTRAESLIMTRGSCVEAETGAVAARLNVFGRASVQPGTCVVSRRLAAGLKLSVGKTVVLRMDRGRYVSAQLPVGRTRTSVAVLRLRVGRVAEEAGLEDSFSLYGTQRPVRNIWVSLKELQNALDVPNGANALFVAAKDGHKGEEGSRALGRQLRETATLEDYGLRILQASRGELSIESRELLLSKHVEEAVLSLEDTALEETRAFSAIRVFAYVVNTVRDLESGREFPYSICAGMSGLPDGPIPPGGIVLNRWAADDLAARPGDHLELVSVVRAPNGLLDERVTRFELDRIIETRGVGADRSLVPEFKGVTDAATLSDWDPPGDFDFHRERLRPKDEDYWKRFGAAPKAFVAIERAQELWGTAFGGLTSVRLLGGLGGAPGGVSERDLRRGLRRALVARKAGFVWQPIRHRQLQAAGGNTDFGQLFVGLSLFVVASSALLVALVMRLSVAQRSRQIGVMFAVGHTARRIRNLFLAEGMIVLGAGGVLGVLGSVAYAWLMLVGLSTLWRDALGTTLLRLSVEGATIAIGFAAGVAVGAFAIWRGVARLQRTRIADILRGRTSAEAPSGSISRRPKALIVAAGLFLAAAAVVSVALATDALGTTLAFFVAGVCLLGSFLAGLGGWLTYVSRTRRASAARMALVGYGVRNASRNPARSVLTAGLLASASFVTVAVGAMKAQAPAGTGGYALVAEFDIPLPYDMNVKEGREYLALTLADPDEDEALWRRVRLVNMRTSPGEDVSCRNLFRPSNPRVTSVPDALAKGRAFSFVSKLEDVENPWELLNNPSPSDAALPVIVDYQTARWTLHKRIGDTVDVIDEWGASRALRIVALLRMSIFQGELLVSEESFRKLFPGQSGYRQVLVEAGPEDAGRIKSVLEEDLADFGVSVETTAARLTSFARVSGSYISAFQVLGGLGTLLGSFGLVAVLIRGVVERRGEIALMSALGFRRGSVALIVSAENAFLLLAGMLAGTVSALFAVAPEFLRSQGQVRSVALTLAFFCAIVAAISVLLTCVSAGAVRRVTPASLRLE